MVKVTFLGTGAAIPTPQHCNAGILLEHGTAARRHIVVDAGPNLMVQLAKLNTDLLALDDVVISHGHGDHVLGFPMLLIAWLVLRRERPVQVYGPAGLGQILESVSMRVYPEVQTYYGRLIRLHELPVDARGRAEILGGNCILSTIPVKHSVPAIALRFDFPAENRTVTFSGDTEPTPAVSELGQGSDLLIHDATYSERLQPGGPYPVHTTARAAGRIASDAHAHSLALVHLSPGYAGHEQTILKEAAETFSGRIFIPQDLDSLEV